MPQVADAFREARRQLSPDAGDPDAQAITCLGCPDTFWRWKGTRVRYCPRCAYQRTIDATEGQRTRSGPVYETAARRQLAHWTAECRRLGLLTAGPEASEPE